MNTFSSNISTEILNKCARVLVSSEPDLRLLADVASTAFCDTSVDSNRAIYAIIQELNARLFPSISEMELILTQSCNFSCRYCFEHVVINPRSIQFQNMSLDTIEAAIDLLIDYSGGNKELVVTYFGGEPTLHFGGIRHATKYIEDRAAEANKVISLHMTSNGYRLTSEMVDYFSEHNIKVLLSIDGLEETHNSYRVLKSGRGTFTKLIDNMQRLKRRQPWIGAKMTIMPAAAANLFENVKGLHLLGVNQFLIGHATGVPWTKAQMETFRNQLKDVRDWYHAQPKHDLRISQFDEETDECATFGCTAARTTISVACNGEIAGCSRITSLDNKKIIGKLGDVKYGLYNLLRRMEMVGCESLRKNCREAGIDKEYHGGCFATNYEDNQNLYKPSLLQHAFSLLTREVCNKNEPA